MKKSDTSLFYKWLATPIAGRLSNRQARSSVLREFVEQGIFPWIESHGYTIAANIKDITNWIANGLYDNAKASHLESTWNFPSTNTEYTEEEFSHYRYCIGPDEWSNFWSAWNHWEDVSESSFRGMDRRMDIEAFIWSQLDLNNSRQTGVLQEILGDDDTDDELYNYYHTNVARKSKTDIYLQEHDKWDRT